MNLDKEKISIIDKELKNILNQSKKVKSITSMKQPFIKKVVIEDANFLLNTPLKDLFEIKRNEEISKVKLLIDTKNNKVVKANYFSRKIELGLRLLRIRDILRYIRDIDLNRFVKEKLGIPLDSTFDIFNCVERLYFFINKNNNIIGFFSLCAQNNSNRPSLSDGSKGRINALWFNLDYMEYYEKFIKLMIKECKSIGLPYFIVENNNLTGNSLVKSAFLKLGFEDSDTFLTFNLVEPDMPRPRPEPEPQRYDNETSEGCEGCDYYNGEGCEFEAECPY